MHSVVRTAFIMSSILFVLAAGPCFGQVNVEDQRLARDSSGFGGSINLSIEIERGNSDLTEIGLAPVFAYRSGPNLWFALNSYSFVEAEGGAVVNEGFSHLRYNYDLSRRVVPEMFVQLQYDREQQLERRNLLGGGIRVELVEIKGKALAVGLTAMYEYENLEGGESVHNARNSNYLATRLRINNTMTVSNTVYVQPVFDDWGDIRVLDDMQLSFAIARWLAMTLAVEYRYDSRPPEGVKEYDFSLKNGLKVLF